MSTIMRKQVDNVNLKVELAEQVVDAVHAVMHLVRARQFRALKEGAHELNHMEAKVLGFFAAHPGAAQGDLVRHSGRDKGQIARLIAALRERGLLEAVADDTDRRSVRLAVSATGRALQGAVREQARVVSAQALEGLGDAERRQLLQLLSAVRGNLERDEPSR